MATKLDPKTTWIPASILAAIIVITGGSAWTAAEWKSALDTNTRAIDQLSLTLDRVIADRWTYRDMEAWTDTMKVLNPDLIFPRIPPRDN